MLQGSSCGIAPCGVPSLRSAEEYLTLAYAGGCPGRFEVGCQIPMRFTFAIPLLGDTVEILPKQPSQPIALVADRSGAGLVLTQINGPDGKSIGMEGDGISGVPYDLGEFTNEALRSNVNPWPTNVGLINATNGMEFIFGAGLAVDFTGILYGFVPGYKGIKYAQGRGMVNDQELPMWGQLSQWQESGKPPMELMQRLEALAARRRIAGLE